ncbi:hypothetical protein Gpo141_00004613 [Globisporangium polare]
MTTMHQRPFSISPLLRLLLVVLVAQLRSPASAADCSATQIATIRAFDANATEVCGSSLLSTSAASVICAKPACLSYIISLEAQVPYCDIAGVNIRTIFAFASSYCAQQSNETDAVSYTKQPSSGATMASSSFGYAVLVSAVAALLLTLAIAL